MTCGCRSMRYCGIEHYMAGATYHGFTCRRIKSLREELSTMGAGLLQFGTRIRLAQKLAQVSMEGELGKPLAHAENACWTAAAAEALGLFMADNAFKRHRIGSSVLVLMVRLGMDQEAYNFATWWV